MTLEPFLYLKILLAGYFHPECYDLGDTDETIVRDFCQSARDYHRLGVRADIKRLLYEHVGSLLEVMPVVFAPWVDRGKNEDAVEAWLLKVERLVSRD